MAPPKLFVADELSLGLAPVVIETVYEGLRKINRAGTALLVVEQQVDRAVGLADEAVILEHGTVAYAGPADGAMGAMEQVLASRTGGSASGPTDERPSTEHHRWRPTGKKPDGPGRRPQPRCQVDSAPEAGRHPGRGRPAAVGEPASKRALRSQGSETMRRLLDAAMEAIDERGYHSTRVKDVVDIANTSHGTFYLYFSNKEDLVRALTIEATSEASRLLGAVTEAGSALDIESWDNLRQWIGDYSALWSRYAPLFRSWTDLASIDRAIGDQNRTDGGRPHRGHGLPDRRGRADRRPRPRAWPAWPSWPCSTASIFMREFMGTPVDDAALDTLTTMVHRALFPRLGRRARRPRRSRRAAPTKAGGAKKKRPLSRVARPPADPAASQVDAGRCPRRSAAPGR